MIYIAVVLALIILFIWIIKISLNRLFVIGFVYVIRRDNGKSSDKHVATGFMRGISPPWYTGRGIQARIGTQVVQIGVCRKNKHHKEDEGVLSAMGGRYMDVTAKDIREW